MATRRGFLSTLIAAATVPRLGWAAAGAPSYLACAKDLDDSFALYGLTSLGARTFRIPLPARGHAGAGHPTRAEAWRSGRPLANAVGAVTGAYALASDIATGPTPLSNAAFAAVGDAAARISDPTFQDIDDPQARLRVEVLQQRVKALKDAIEDELGLASGFNSADGD